MTVSPHEGHGKDVVPGPTNLFPHELQFSAFSIQSTFYHGSVLLMGVTTFSLNKFRISFELSAR